jgi:hypothetical protein
LFLRSDWSVGRFLGSNLRPIVRELGFKSRGQTENMAIFDNNRDRSQRNIGEMVADRAKISSLMFNRARNEIKIRMGRLEHEPRIIDFVHEHLTDDRHNVEKERGEDGRRA